MFIPKTCSSENLPSVGRNVPAYLLLHHVLFYLAQSIGECIHKPLLSGSDKKLIETHLPRRTGRLESYLCGWGGVLFRFCFHVRFAITRTSATCGTRASNSAAFGYDGLSSTSGQ